MVTTQDFVIFSIKNFAVLKFLGLKAGTREFHKKCLKFSDIIDKNLIGVYSMVMSQDFVIFFKKFHTFHDKVQKVLEKKNWKLNKTSFDITIVQTPP